MSERRLRLLCAVAVVAGAVLLPAVPASAHASLVAATPPPGTALPQAPGAVVIRFTEPLNPRLSRIEVLDEDGCDVGAGKTTLVGDDATVLRRRLPLLEPGRFTVRWTTVSTLDGHMRRGSYVFGIGTTASAAQRVVDGPVASQGWPGLVGRFVALEGSACGLAPGCWASEPVERDSPAGASPPWPLPPPPWPLPAPPSPWCPRPSSPGARPPPSSTP